MFPRLPALVAVAALLGACSVSPKDTNIQPARTGPPATTSTPSVEPEPSAQTDATGSGDLEVLVGDTLLTARLRDTAAARDLRALLPLTIEMSDHGGVEKTGPLPSALSTTDDPDGADPNVGDLGYYAPGGNLVLYYGDQAYFDGIVILGQLGGDLDVVADVDGDVTVEVRPSDG